MSARRLRLITFDVYTALFDVEGSLTPVVARLLEPAVDHLGLVRAWRRKQLEYALISNSLSDGRVPFRLVTRRALDDTLARAGLALAETVRQELVAAWDDLRPWPEAAAVLTAVKARGYLIGLLSNGDAAMLRALGGRLPAVIDHIFASEHAGHYKPHPAVYALPIQALGLPAEAILHVAGSSTDVMGARAVGLACAWSNRLRERVLDPDLKATYEWPDLRGLLEVV